MIVAIAAITRDWLIGVNGKIPWTHQEDRDRFHRMVQGGTLVFGRKTYDGFSQNDWRRLKEHDVIIVSRDQIPYVKTAHSIQDALSMSETSDTWICGGGEIYRAAIEADVVDMIDLTVVPDRIPDQPGAVRFPKLDPLIWDIPTGFNWNGTGIWILGYFGKRKW